MAEVFKHDGTRQCGLGVEESLEVARAALERLGATITKAEKRRWPSPIIQACGAVTGWCNVFELSDECWPLLAKVILGAGYAVWPDDDDRFPPSSGEAVDCNKTRSEPDPPRLFSAGQEGAEDNPIPCPLSHTNRPQNDWNVWPLSLEERTVATRGTGMTGPFNSGGGAVSVGCMAFLRGKMVRVYRDGDMVTQDCRPDRVNLVLHRESGRIIDVWFG